MKKLLLFFLLFISSTVSAQMIEDVIVVRVNYNYLNFNIVDNTSISEIKFKHLLNAEGKEQLKDLESIFPKVGDFPMLKIFPFLQTDDTVSISRTGYKVTIPPFWATFKMFVPEEVSYLRLMSRLNKMVPLIDYAHGDYEIELANVPNDPRYPLQTGLNDSIQDINIERAWEIVPSAGERWIKIGVHDTGIDTLHEDLDSSVIFGGAYWIHSNVLADWGTAIEPHGSQVGGIIAARRNNGIGVAGVAGGDGSDSTGCSLIDLKYPFATNPGSSYMMAGIVDAARSVGTYWQYPVTPYFVYDQYAGQFNDVSDYFQNSPGFGVHVGNHSYVFKSSLPKGPGDGNSGIPDPDCTVCREAYLFSLQNGVINVIARGNSLNASPSNNPTFIKGFVPQIFPDGWHIMVGASATDGNTIEQGVNQSNQDIISGYYSLYGSLDIIAPGSNGNVHTTYTTGTDSLYGRIGGTSASAPYVAGTIGLILSHYNKDCYNRRNLSIEDVEYLLEKSATNPVGLTTPTYTDLYGWGRLNAGAALEMIENPTKQIIHPDSLISSTIVATDTIKIRYDKAFVADGWGPLSQQMNLTREKNYLVERVLVENVYDISQYILPTTNIIDYWARPSVSNSIEFLRDTVSELITISQLLYNYISLDYFQMTPYDSVVSLDTISMEVRTQGYYYHFIEEFIEIPLILLGEIYTVSLDIDSSATIDQWYPANPTVDTARILFSIYIEDSTLTEIYDFPCDSMNILYDEFLNVEEINLDEINIYPNPFSETINVSFINGNSEKEIALFDIHGKLLEKHTTRNKDYTLNTSALSNGFYLLTCVVNGRKSTFKLIKE